MRDKERRKWGRGREERTQLREMKVKVTHSCLTLRDPMAYLVHGILQARILEWTAIPFSRGSSQPRDRTQVSHIAARFFTSWTNREAQGNCRSRQWYPTPVLLPGKSHGRKSLVGCSSWGRQESDTTERLHFHFSLSCIGEGNGSPLQCSCLENPRDGAWRAAVYGVAQSWTWLKWLSS